MTFARHKYRIQLKILLRLALLFCPFAGQARAHFYSDSTQTNLEFLIYEAGDTLNCRILRSARGEIFFWESVKSKKKIAYLHLPGDSVFYQLDFSRKKYKKQNLPTAYGLASSENSGKGKKKFLLLFQKTDTLRIMDWRNDSLAYGILNPLLLRYPKWPSELIPARVIAERILWENKKVIMDKMRLSVQPLEPVLFRLPDDFIEKKADYRVSPE